MVVPTFVEQALKNQPITVYGDGLQTRSFCNVLDTVTALDLIMNNPESNGEIINIGNNDECSINDLAKLVKEKAKSQSEITHLSYKEAYGVDFHDVQVRRPNIDKLKRLTGFQPQWSLEQTVQQIIEKTQASIS
jgi:UDP-glucose 4-epimerase